MWLESSFFEFFLEPFICELFQLPQLVHFGYVCFFHESQFGSGVHEHDFGLAVSGGQENEAEGKRDPAVRMLEPETVNDKSRQVLRELFSELVYGDILEDLAVGHHGHGFLIDLHD